MGAMSDYPKCRRCGAQWEPVFERCETGVHFGKETCQACGAFIRWVPKPSTERKAREAAHRDLVRKFSLGFCELCGILEESLPRGETLHAHHVDEYQDGGEPVRSNIQIVCTACHSLIHWRRTYVRHLLPTGVKHVDRKEHPAGDANQESMGPLEDGQTRE